LGEPLVFAAEAIWRIVRQSFSQHFEEKSLKK
jgi:hypothetical protein